MSQNEKINFLPIEYQKKGSTFYYLPYFLTIIWSFFQLIAVIIISIPNFINAFTIISILIIIGISFFSLYFSFRIFIKLEKDKKRYNIFRSFMGYGIVFTYVFTSLPRLIGTFNENISFSFSLTCFILTLISTALVTVAYLFIKSPQTRLFMEIFNQKEIEFEKKMKKDKKLKKQEQKKLRVERTILENIWYEWVDVLIQAIIIALLIQQFLFQMYQIPSESMVPTFLISDRVVVNKFIYGPHIPLTDWKLPGLREPKVGEIVVFKNPDENIKYENAFVRVMHPFIYMLTLSMVDIDKKKDGTPKERFIVKRLVAKDGEKLCILNDKVFKKMDGTEWTEMGKIQGQKEYGYNEIYNDKDPRIKSQRITKKLKEILNKSEELINNMNVDEVEKNLITEKNKFISNVERGVIDSYNKEIERIIFEYSDKIYSSLENVSNYEQVVFNLNNKEVRKSLSTEGIDYYITNYNKIIDTYHQVVIFKLIEDFKTFFDEGKNDIFFYKENIGVNYNPNSSDSPYSEYMKKLNLYNKYLKMFLFNNLISNFSYLRQYLNDSDAVKKSIYIKEIMDYNNISFYLYGYGESSFNYFAEIFGLRNFSDYPSEKDVYLKKEFFMMGDNRYNSLDSRLGHSGGVIKIDNTDNTKFSTTVNVSWSPHTIKEKHILGKAVAIYFPLDRFGLLK